ncbi:unnamed protein product [Acanthoscelides obtectus]|uniref:Interference hedgehog n=1 Tax=Acanthoscelides obtectus TaxID=200917 RepID=A0A9P0K2D5_ACAOB|nr:unnamed protein product [Acanthoscelides obtectus]CAK1623886.1 Interference hedgehog [Acanthoscelides obtectus]
MGDYEITSIFAVLLTFFLKNVLTGSEHVISNPEPVTLPAKFSTLLSCEMSSEPDRFMWKFYPTDDPYNPNAYIDLSNISFRVVPEKQYTKQKRKSELTLHLDASASGDYQCLAFYGTKALASVPSRVTMARLEPFPKQNSLEETVSVGNTVTWRCAVPKSNPEAYIQYFKDGQFLNHTDVKMNSLILPNVKEEDTGVYTCIADNGITDSVNSSAKLNLRIVRNGPSRAPYFLIEPKDVYTILKGKTVFLECTAIGNPVPKVIWTKQKGQLPNNRIETLKGGLRIRDVSSQDEGVYICNHTNAYGTISHRITLVYNEEPRVDCHMRETSVKVGENLDIDCSVRGVPEPYVTWILNGFSVNNDSSIEAIGNKIYFRPVERRHAGVLQLFARNIVKTVFGHMSLNVLPEQNGTNTNPHGHHRHRGKSNVARKHNKSLKIIPPSKPTVSRLNDESVVVRWSIPHNTGMGVQFFKVQYRELGSHNSHNKSKNGNWRTMNAEIPANIRDFDVTGLRPDHVYRFRVAAVYTNNDHKLSPNSEKFHLKRLDFDLKNPLPIPLVTHTEPVNTTCVKIHWKIHKAENVSIDGFYISYMPATHAGDYMKVTIEGADKDEFEYYLNYLQPDTIYDIKLQSYNSKFPSDFSPIMKARTKPKPKSPQKTTQSPVVSSAASTEKAGLNLYVIVAGTIIGFALLICGVALVFVCRKWKQKKSVDSRPKSGDDHHGSEYGVDKSSTRCNGTVSNKITITPNPLADADNKTYLARLFSRLRT